MPAPLGSTLSGPMLRPLRLHRLRSPPRPLAARRITRAVAGVMMPPTPLAALLVLPATPAPRPPLGLALPYRRARGTVARAAALRALPRCLELWSPRLAAVESGPPSSQSSEPPPQPGAESQGATSGLDAGFRGGGGGDGGGDADLGWVRVFPHVLTASMANFLFGYHIGVMNGPIEDIARELG